MTELDPRPRLSPVVWAVAAAAVAMVVSTAGRYGIFRDEYYYLMCADHLAWGYVDHPPLAMAFLKFWKSLFGDSALALRFPPALLNGLTALGAALVARELRGGAAAQVMTAVAVALMPGVLALGAFYSMNSFDVAFWVLLAWIVCRLLDPSADRRWWWGLGLAFGLGLLNKYSVLFVGVGLAVGVVFSPLRRELFSRYRIVGAALALVLVLPHLVWQVRAGWPTLEFMRNAHDLKNVALSPGDFWSEQLLMAHPLYAPIWLTGLVGLLLAPRLRPWRPLGVAFGVVGLWLTFSHAKPYYLVPAYTLVMPAGAVLITHGLARWRRLGRIAAVALPLLLALGGLIVAPLAIPLLSPDDFVAWEQTLGLRPRNAEHNTVGVLPQHFSDRFGWEEMARTVSGVAETLSPGERTRCLVVADNYGECGAINYWGLPAGVRPAVSGHNSCYTWWPADFEPEIVLVVGGSRERQEETFTSVELGAMHHSEMAMPFEQDVPVWICRGWKVDPSVARQNSRSAV